MPREFDITIGPDGRVELEIRGHKGKRCLDAMKLFQEIVGELQSKELTHEYYAPEEDVRINIEHKH